MTTSATHTERSPAAATVDPRRWIALAVVLSASFMVLLDVTIVNVAIPSIQRDRHASYGEIQFVIALYQLAYGAGLITGGRLGDIFGRKRLFIVGVTGFTIASALCGAAQTPVQLVLARVLQGLMASLMYPQVLSVIQVSFPPRERGTAFGIFGGVIGVASISGPIIGGLLIQANVLGTDWRPIFLVNVPVGILAVIAAVRFLAESRAPRARRLDIPGALLASSGLVLLIFPLVEGKEAGWPLWTYGSLAASVAVLALFAVYNRRRDRRTGAALVAPALFEDRAFVVGMVIMVVFFAGLPAFFFSFSVYLQVGLGFTALQAGVTTVPFAVTSALGSGISVRLAPRVGKRILQLGCAILVAGLCGIALTMHLAGVGMKGYYLIPSLMVAGLGLGFVVAPLATIVLSGVHHGDAGSASGVLTTMQQVGGSLGIAVVGIVLFTQLAAHAPVVAASHAATVSAALQRQGVPPTQAATIAGAFERCFIDRAAQHDPTVVPQSCTSTRDHLLAPTASLLGSTLSAEAAQALAEDFQSSETYAIGLDAVFFLVVGVLVFLLPRPDSQSMGRETFGGG